MPETSTLIVRAAALGDAEQIAHLHTISWQHAYKNILSDDYLAHSALADRLSVWHQRFAPENQDSYKTWLAYEGEVLAGFICVVLGTDDRWGTLIDNLHVRPDFQRRGVGRALMQCALAWVAQNQPDLPLHLCVYEENSGARAFYDKLGGKVVERKLELHADKRYGYSLVYIWQNPSQLSGLFSNV